MYPYLILILALLMANFARAEECKFFENDQRSISFCKGDIVVDITQIYESANHALSIHGEIVRFEGPIAVVEKDLHLRLGDSIQSTKQLVFSNLANLTKRVAFLPNGKAAGDIFEYTIVKEVPTSVGISLVQVLVKERIFEVLYAGEGHPGYYLSHDHHLYLAEASN